MVRLPPQRSSYFEHCKSAEPSVQEADRDQKSNPRAAPSVSWEFGKISIFPPEANRIADRVWLADSADEEPEALKKSMEESRDETQNLATLSDGQRVVAAEPRPASLSMLQHVADQGGAFVSGPPVGTGLPAVVAIGGAGTLGWTYFPSGFKAPDFDFNTTTGAGAGAASGLNWTCDPTLKSSASEGTADSFYTSAGKYNSGRKEGGKDVYYNFSPTISSLIKTGEQEHCDDHMEAYKISLQEAESVLKQNVVGKTFGPAASESDAEKLVLQAIDDKLNHKALGSDKTKWADTYRTLFKKTAIRDGSKWHNLSKGARTETATDVTYEIVQGAAQVGSHPSSSIIKY